MTAHPSLSLKDRVAVVTGAGGLLGREHCRALSEAGATVVAADLSLPQTLRPEIGAQRCLEFDITNRSAVFNAARDTMEAFGRIDVLVNNAAINDRVEDPSLEGDASRFEVFPEELWRKSLEVNLSGTFFSLQAFGGLMAKQGSGSIINIGSTYGLVGPKQSIYRNEMGEQTQFKSPAYSATKGAVINLTRHAAAYWGEHGVRVNCLCPGGVENGQSEHFIQSYSQQTPLKRMARPGDYRSAIVFLASEGSSYMTGSTLVVDGGWTAW